MLLRRLKKVEGGGLTRTNSEHEILLQVVATVIIIISYKTKRAYDESFIMGREDNLTPLQYYLIIHRAKKRAV